MNRPASLTSVLRRRAGFTFPEILTGMVVFSLVGAAITSVVVGTISGVGYQARMADAQLDVASAMALIQDDLRAAGYITDNMNQGVFQQITSGTTTDSITFVGDVNADNVSDRITYAVDGNSRLMRTQQTWNGVSSWTEASAQPIASNVTAFTLTFRLADPCTGAISSQTASQVTSTGQTTFISVTLTGTGTYKGKTVSRTLTSDIAERQQNVRPSWFTNCS